MAWYDKLGDILLGQDPNKVQLPDVFGDVAKQREQLAGQLGQTASGARETEGERAARMAGEQQREALARSIMSSAGGARGMGRLAADLGAVEGTAQAEQGLAGQLAATQAAQRAQDIQRAQQMLAGVLGQQEQSALMQQQLREQQAKPGLLPVLGGLGGGLLGMKLGGPQGAQAGMQAGGALGSGFTR